MSGIEDLPRWVWEVVADLLDEEDVHPVLFVEAIGGWDQYEWCPKIVLDKIPDDVRAAARVIATYRRSTKGVDDEQRCGRHTGHVSNRCLLAAGHAGACDDLGGT